MSPSFSTSVASTPVSSRTSRSAASAADSAPSGWPFGSASTLLPSAARRVGTMTMQRPSRTTTPPAENSESAPVGTGASVDVALEGVRVVDGDPPAALRDDPGALEDRQEAAGRLTRRAGELGDVGLRDLDQHVPLTGAALRARLLDELAEHDGDAALHRLERLAREAFVGLAQPASERDDELDGDVRVLAQEAAHVRARDGDRVDRVERLDRRRASFGVEHGQLAEDVARAEVRERDRAPVDVLAHRARVAAAHHVAGVALVALAEDDLLGVEAARYRDLRDAAQVLGPQRLEHGHGAQERD